MKRKEIKSCYECGAWDSDREGCTMPSSDMLYACPIHSLPDEELEKIFSEEIFDNNDSKSE